MTHNARFLLLNPLPQAGEGQTNRNTNFNIIVFIKQE